MKICTYCKVSKRNADFISVRGRELKLCIRCRELFHTQKMARKERSSKYDSSSGTHEQSITEFNKDNTSDHESDETSNSVETSNQIEDINLTEFIEAKKAHLQNQLKRYSKKAIVKFFSNVEPELGEALEHIESEELKDLVKIWLNTQYLNSINN